MLTGKNREISLRFIQAYRNLYALQAVKSKAEFCRQIGLYPQNFSLVEKGRTGCTLENVYKLASSFNVSLDWLFLGEGDFLNARTAV